MWITRVLRPQEPFRLDSMPMHPPMLDAWAYLHFAALTPSVPSTRRTAALACRPPRSGCGDWACPKNRPAPTALRPWRRNRTNRPHHTNPHDRCRSGRRMTRNRHWRSSPASGRVPAADAGRANSPAATANRAAMAVIARLFIVCAPLKLLLGGGTGPVHIYAPARRFIRAGKHARRTPAARADSRARRPGGAAGPRAAHSPFSARRHAPILLL